MQTSFPDFADIAFEQSGASSVYASFIERGRKEPIRVSGVSDGHLQLLIHLTALFAEGRQRPSLLLFDEPELSLHPYAISIFAQAVKEAVNDWGRQVVIATHSPVLLSQFDASSIIAAGIGDEGQTIFTRVQEIEEIQDLLDQYAIGSLYMAEAVAGQSKVARGLKDEK